jgi:DNA helicase-2/ATP-dependent DNA helicase PcrA
MVLEALPDQSDLSKAKLISARKIIRKARSVDSLLLEEYLQGASKLFLGIEPKDNELTALKNVINDSDAIRQYTPITSDEIQCMTLHKSKGLEFEIVIHLDLSEWIFPFQQVGASFSDKIYPDWEQDLNLHFVGVTRAKSICLLAHTTMRLNGAGETKNGSPSAFLSLPGVQGLFKTFTYPQ